MKRYSASSKFAQKWILAHSLDMLKIGAIYDELGHYNQSESLYNKAVKISSFIRISEELSEEENDEDVDVLYVDDVNNERYEIFELEELESRNTGTHGSTAIEERWISNSTASNIREVKKYLAVGGNNVFASLKSLSDHLQDLKTKLPLDIVEARFDKKTIRYGLSSYYQNHLFSTDSKGEVIARNIYDGRVDRDTVAVCAKIFDQFKVIKDQAVSLNEFINKIILEEKPELSGNKVVEYYLFQYIKKYIYTHYKNDFSSNENEIRSYVRTFNIDKFNLSLSIFEQNFQRPNFNTSLVDFVSIYRLLSQYNFDGIEQKLQGTIRFPGDRGSIERNFDEYLRNKLFGFDSKAFDVKSQNLYPGLAESAFQFFKAKRYTNITESDLNMLLAFGFDSLEEKITGDKSTIGLINDSIQKLKQEDPDFNSFVTSTRKENPILYRLSKVSNNDDEFMTIFKDDHKCKMLLIHFYFQYYSKYKANSSFIDVEKLNKAVAYHGVENVINFPPKVVNLISNDINLSTYEEFNTGLDTNQLLSVISHSSEQIENSSKGEELKFYKTFPSLINIPLSEIVELSKKYFGSFDSYLSSNSVNLGKQFVLFGEYAPSKKLICDRINPNSLNSSYKLQHVRSLLSDSNFVGDFAKAQFAAVSLINPYKADDPYNSDFSYSEYYGLKKKYGNVDFLDIIKVRKSIKKSYPNLQWNSREYNKIFLLIARNYEIRGRNANLLLNLFDASRYSSDNFNQSSDLYLMAQVTGNNDFSFLDNLDDFHINNISVRFRVKEICIEWKIKPEHVINRGGFNTLFKMSDKDLAELFSKAGVRENIMPNVLSGIRVLSEMSLGNLSDLQLRMNKNILEKRAKFYCYQLFFSENPQFMNLKESFKDPKFKKKLNIFINKFNSKLYEYTDITSMYDNKLLEIYKNPIKTPQNIILSTDLLNSLDSTANSEYIINAANIIQIFGNLSFQVLDKYANRICKTKGYAQNGFNAVPDLSLKTNIIHDFANELPDDFNQSFRGYAQYFLMYLDKNKNNILKKIGNGWNNDLTIWDDNLNVVKSGKVYEFADLDPFTLHNHMKLMTVQNIVNHLPSYDRKFAIEFAENIDLDDDYSSESSDSEILYVGLERVYLEGKKVPLPNWASFTETLNNITMRFLPRDDPKGMFLGVYTGCCQHIKGYAGSCAMDGHLNKNAAFVVFEKYESIIAQSYVWSDEDGNICFDSIEKKDRFNNIDNDEIKELLITFASSLPSNIKCTVGNNPLGFERTNNPLRNPTKTNEIDYVKDLLEKNHPDHVSSFYRSDSGSQSLIKRNT
jgi:hypothetical protein